jgi:hypothetical protein
MYATTGESSQTQNLNHFNISRIATGTLLTALLFAQAAPGATGHPSSARGHQAQYNGAVANPLQNIQARQNIAFDNTPPAINA